MGKTLTIRGGASNKRRVLNYLATAGGGLPALDPVTVRDVIEAEYGRGRLPAEEAAALLTSWSEERGERGGAGPTVRPVSIAEALDLPKSSVLRILQELRDADPPLVESTGKGQWRSVARPYVFTADDVLRLAPTDKHRQKSQGFRAFVNPDGSVEVVVHTPGRSYHARGTRSISVASASKRVRPSLAHGATDRRGFMPPLYKFGPDTMLWQAWDDASGSWIPLLATEIRGYGLHVMDCDGRVCDPPPHMALVGTARTSRGWHLYFEGEPPEEYDVRRARGDIRYHRISIKRGRWAERLLNDDSTTRDLPELRASSELMRAHRQAFAQAQRMLAIQGIRAHESLPLAELSDAAIDGGTLL